MVSDHDQNTKMLHFEHKRALTAQEDRYTDLENEHKRVELNLSAFNDQTPQAELSFNQLDNDPNRTMNLNNITYGSSEESKRVEELEKIVEKKKIELKEQDRMHININSA